MKKTLFLHLLQCFVGAQFAEADAKTSLKWELGFSKTADETPAKWIPALIPGAVQIDIAKAEKYAPYYYAEHWKDYLWMEDQFYTYRTRFQKPEFTSCERVVLISKALASHRHVRQHAGTHDWHLLCGGAK